ncbi:hypothetical protein TNIN_120331 [Trichonephila inaurata madagascariensis]|uniref:Uncharacterized protein n=1 Tax=Trichonephila inaurata madagascariensis TaxID=2747483 RepID=A0A8X6IDX1_9ARAC|nr:hypothetical protein TNIN_120331 [Trichonephila inaurata madagascariensis]
MSGPDCPSETGESFAKPLSRHHVTTASKEFLAQSLLLLSNVADPDPAKPTSVDKSSITNTSPSTVSATPHHSQQGTSEQSSKLRVRFAEPPAEYATRSGRVVQPSK